MHWKNVRAAWSFVREWKRQLRDGDRLRRLQRRLYL
jgi:hypothetical protein